MRGKDRNSTLFRMGRALEPARKPVFGTRNTSVNNQARKQLSATPARHNCHINACVSPGPDDRIGLYNRRANQSQLPLNHHAHIVPVRSVFNLFSHVNTPLARSESALYMHTKQITNCVKLQNQHGVAKAVKTVFGSDCIAICC